MEGKRRYFFPAAALYAAHSHSGIHMVLPSLEEADHSLGVRPVHRLSQDLPVYSDHRIRADHDDPVTVTGPDFLCDLHCFLQREGLHCFRRIRRSDRLFTLRRDHIIFRNDRMQKFPSAR